MTSTTSNDLGNYTADLEINTDGVALLYLGFGVSAIEYEFDPGCSKSGTGSVYYVRYGISWVSVDSDDSVITINTVWTSYNIYYGLYIRIYNNFTNEYKVRTPTQSFSKNTFKLEKCHEY